MSGRACRQYRNAVLTHDQQKIRTIELDGKTVKLQIVSHSEPSLTDDSHTMAAC
jgi:hypothetical protein